jgi:hypothetical protein
MVDRELAPVSWRDLSDDNVLSTCIQDQCMNTELHWLQTFGLARHVAWPGWYQAVTRLMAEKPVIKSKHHATAARPSRSSFISGELKAGRDSIC